MASRECFLPEDIQQNILEAAAGEIAMPDGGQANNGFYRLYLQERQRQTRLTDENVRRWHNQAEVCDWSIFGESCADCPITGALANIDIQVAEQQESEI